MDNARDTHFFVRRLRSAEMFEREVSELSAGTLPDERRLEVERRLEADPAASELLEEYGKLDALLQAEPEWSEAQFEGLTSSVMAIVRRDLADVAEGETDAPAPLRLAPAADRRDLFNRPVRRWGTLSAAAGLLVAAGLSVALLQREPLPEGPIEVAGPKPVLTLDDALLAVDGPAGPGTAGSPAVNGGLALAILDVSGPPRVVEGLEDTLVPETDVVSSPGKVVVAGVPGEVSTNTPVVP